MGQETGRKIGNIGAGQLPEPAMTSREKDIVFYILVALFLFVLLYVGLDQFASDRPPVE